MNIAFDSHKRYTLCSVAGNDGRVLEEARIEHERGAIAEYLSRYGVGEAVAVETIGNWYWIVDEIEAAGLRPLLVHARKAKVMMGCINKTDRLDVRGLNRLQQAGTLPTVWIPPGELRDKRDLTRTRMFLVAGRTRLKNRVHAALAKYALSLKEVSDIFGKQGRPKLIALFGQLPVHTRYTTGEQLGHIDYLDATIRELDKRIEEIFGKTVAISLLRSAPGIGEVLSIVVNLEVGEVSRFPSAPALASYSGTVPRVHASGGRVRYGQLRPDVNRYLKWAYSEAANSIVVNRKIYPHRHVTKLYERVRAKKGHQKAIGAVSRHLAEATYWILKKQEPYQEPSWRQKVSTRV
jgi:transposase